MKMIVLLSLALPSSLAQAESIRTEKTLTPELAEQMLDKPKDQLK